ncbi:MAG: DUF1598 domain-containing protein [Pirellulales bacterium]
MVCGSWVPGHALAQGTIGAVELSPFVIGVRPVVRGGAVGGVLVDPQGMLGEVELDELGQLREARLQALEEIPSTLAAASPLRKISLGRLEALLDEHRRQGVPLSDCVQCLAGLQSIRYVLVYPEQNDIVLAGPAEGWRVDAAGHIVGISSGRPVLLLDDLVVALRTARQAAQGGISCSIDPTAEGLRRLQQLVPRLRSTVPDEPTIRGIEEQLGPQTISIQGVPATSHFARVLVTADFRMKRLAMNFEPSPVEGLSSYLELLKPSPRGIQNLLPRWWLASRCEPLLVDPRGLAWELRAVRVKTLTENDVLAGDGSRTRSGRSSPAARKWADQMTARYDELSLQIPVFGELRNLVDLSLVAALLVKHDLAERAGCRLELLSGPSAVKVSEFAEPQGVPSAASFVRKGGNWVICVSGGVVIDSWGALESIEPSDALTSIRGNQTPPDNDAWWWD